MSASSIQHRLGTLLAGVLVASQLHAEVRIANPALFQKSVRAAAETTFRYHILEDHPDAHRVTEIGYRIVAASAFDKYPFSFGVVDMPIPNAFALPAGQIFITRGMLALDLTDDQLAALLGHEVAHVTEEHFLKMKRRANLLNALAQVVTVGAIAAAANADDDYYVGPGGYVVRDRNPTADLAMAAQSTSMVLSELLLRSYSRNHENDSDEVGQRLAAAAGYSPDGARQLMAKMRARIPQEKSFGYWQTHPFFDERIAAAEARAEGLKALEPADEVEIASLRVATQRLLNDFEPERSGRNRRQPSPQRSPERPRSSLNAPEPPTVERIVQDFLETAALTAWPVSETAVEIRAGRLHRERDTEFERLPTSRDYGRLIRAWEQQLAQIGRDAPDSGLATLLEAELETLRSEAAGLYEKARTIFDNGVYERPFLESFLSNYPDSEVRRKAALQLGLAYSRLGHEADAVAAFLEAWGPAGEPRTGEPDEVAASAARGLRNLTPVLTQLSALEQLVLQERDLELQELAARRLDQQVSRFEEIENGSRYLERFPDGLYTATVESRIEELAENLYREMMLYQQIGDSAKSIAKAERILRSAPTSAAARRLSQQLEEEAVE